VPEKTSANSSWKGGVENPIKKLSQNEIESIKEGKK